VLITLIDWAAVLQRRKYSSMAASSPGKRDFRNSTMPFMPPPELMSNCSRICEKSPPKSVRTRQSLPLPSVPTGDNPFDEERAAGKGVAACKAHAFSASPHHLCRHISLLLLRAKHHPIVHIIHLLPFDLAPRRVVKDLPHHPLLVSHLPHIVQTWRFPIKAVRGSASMLVGSLLLVKFKDTIETIPHETFVYGAEQALLLVKFKDTIETIPHETFVYGAEQGRAHRPVSNSKPLSTNVCRFPPWRMEMAVSPHDRKKRHQQKLGPSHQHSSPPASSSAPAPHPPSKGCPIFSINKEIAI